jgi:hypothetical protein
MGHSSRGGVVPNLPGGLFSGHLREHSQQMPSFLCRIDPSELLDRLQPGAGPQNHEGRVSGRVFPIQEYSPVCYSSAFTMFLQWTLQIWCWCAPLLPRWEVHRRSPGWLHAYVVHLSAAGNTRLDVHLEISGSPSTLLDGGRLVDKVTAAVKGHASS